jgi:hypothetical protein
MASVSLIVALSAVAVAATLLACTLRFTSAVSFVLAVYLIAWAEIVTVVFALSIGKWVERWALVVGFTFVAAVALTVWIARGRPTPPPLRQATLRAVIAAADPLVALPLVTSALALLYSLIVTLTTSPNDGDPLVYELTRAAFWRQEGGVTLLGATYEPRLDYSPPVAEIGDLTLLTLSGSERLVGMTQWIAVPALALATYGISRRIGLQMRPALWGAAIVPMFPVVILQSWSAFTDLVFSTFAVSAVYFAIGGLGPELIAVTLAVGLAMGTKFLGPIYAPLFALIVALAQPARNWLRVGAAAIAGSAIASLWYLRTQFEEGDPAGNSGVGLQSREIAAVLTTFHRLSVEIFDLSGAPGADVWVFACLALGVAVLGLGLSITRRTGATEYFLAAALIALAPHLVAGLGRIHARSGIALGDALGRPDLVDQLRDWTASEVADGAFSWFGPTGAMLVISVIPVSVAEVRSRRLSPAALALAASPLIAIALVSITIAYQHYQGRYFVSAFALCTATFGGFALRHRWVGATVVGVAATTVVLSLVNSLGKPSGAGFLRGDPGRSVWSMPRWEQQGILRSTAPERDEVMTLRFVEEHVPEDAQLGIALSTNDLAFPYFGPKLTRQLTIVDEGDVIPARIDWLVASPERSPVGCKESWVQERRGPFGWRTWRRVAPDVCTNVARLDPS